MPGASLAQSLQLPELKITNTRSRRGAGIVELELEKTSEFEVCPKCATPSWSTYDRRWVRIWDDMIRALRVLLHIRKRRFYCKPCRKPFTEPVAGIGKGKRHTDRFRRSVLEACERFSDIKKVRKVYRCSAGFVYDLLYKELARKERARRHPWPQTVGIDEHYFRRGQYGHRGFVTMLVDYNHRKLMEVVEGKQAVLLEQALKHIPGRQNVRYVVLDLCDPFKSFARNFFPNAACVADKFHVLRLLNPAINRYRKAITGDRRSLKVRRLLLRTAHRLEPKERWMLQTWLEKHPDLREIYHFKEALHRFYRMRGQRRAKYALTAMTDSMAQSKLPEIKTLRRTLMRWRNEILRYFECRLTNARTEGFNNKAKVVKRRAYGYRRFENYRLRLLNACAS